MQEITRESQVLYLWLSNDEPMYRATRPLVNNPEALEECIREWFEDEWPVGMTRDLLTIALSRVDWQQLAERLSD